MSSESLPDEILVIRVDDEKPVYVPQYMLPASIREQIAARDAAVGASTRPEEE